LVFSVPLLLWTPDVVTQPIGKLEAVRRGVGSLAQVVPKLREHRNATRFLIARMLYNEGFIVIAMLTGIYAAGTLHWTSRMLILQGLINSVCAVLGGLIAGRLDRFFGARASTFAFLAGSLIVGLVFSTITPTSVLTFSLPQGTTGGPFPGSADKIFVVTMAGTALFITAAMASSRALMARLSPPGMQTEFFALYALSGTATAFFGPLAMGLATSWFGDQRAGVAVGVLFVTVGLILLIRVRESSASVQQPQAGNRGNWS
jgi:UMF1 family MFS transporter